MTPDRNKDRRTEFDLFGRNLQRIRKENGWRQADLAEEIGEWTSSIGRWESLLVEPKASTVAYVAQALGISTDELLTDVKLKD